MEALGRGPCQLHYVYGPGLAGSGPAPCGELREWLSARWGTREAASMGGMRGEQGGERKVGKEEGGQ